MTSEATTKVAAPTALTKCPVCRELVWNDQPRRTIYPMGNGMTLHIACARSLEKSL